MHEKKRKPAAHEITQIRADEWNPETHERVFQFEPAAHQEERKPVRHHVPVGIENRLGENDAPGLAVADQLGHGRARFGRDLVCARARGKNHGPFGSTDAGVVLRTMIRRQPGQQPQESERPRDEKRRPPGAERVIEPDDQRWRDRPSNSRAAIE